MFRYFLIRVHGSKGNANIEIACKQFFPLLDLTFNAPSYLSGPLQKKLQALYPEVKVCGHFVIIKWHKDYAMLEKKLYMFIEFVG